MQTVRRLYLYGMSGITLGVLLTGLNNLFVVVFHALGLGRGTLGGGSSGDRELLSLAIALTVVGLLVWTVHWLLVERSLRPANPAADEERASPIRALYLSLVLAVLLVFGVIAGVQLLEQVALRLFGISASDRFEFFSIDSGAALATVLVTGLAWLYHAAIRRRDLDAPMAGGGAWMPRVYLYGAALLGLVMTAINIGSLLRFAFDVLAGPAPDFADPGFARRAGADALAGIVGWGIVFIGHWWYATSLLRGDGWRGVSERGARLRLAYFVAVILASAIATVTFGAQSLSSALGLALGVERDFASESALQSVVGPALGLLPWLAAWFVHQRWMIDEARDGGQPERPVSVARLSAATIGLVGIAAAGAGAAGVLGLLLDIVLGGNRTDAGFWRRELAEFMAVGFVGAALWLWNWANLQTRRGADPEGEARSTVRRAYLLVVVGVSLLASLASLALLLYRLFNTILGVDDFTNAASTVSAALGVLLVAAGVAAYHGVAERRDRALRGPSPFDEAAAAPDGGQAAEARGPTASAPPAVAPRAERALRLSAGTAAELDAAMAGMRSRLPAGVELEEVPAAD
jgi:hypothetical protein